MEPGNPETWLAAIHAATHAMELARAEIRDLQWQLSILKRDYDNSRYACVELVHHFDAHGLSRGSLTRRTQEELVAIELGANGIQP